MVNLFSLNNDHENERINYLKRIGFEIKQF